MIDVQIRRVNDDNVAGGRRQHRTIAGIHAIIVAHTPAAANAVRGDFRPIDGPRLPGSNGGGSAKLRSRPTFKVCSSNGSPQQAKAVLDRGRAPALAPAAGWTLGESESAAGFRRSRTRMGADDILRVHVDLRLEAAVMLGRAPASAVDSHHLDGVSRRA
jgi:hypothetical protein